MQVYGISSVDNAQKPIEILTVCERLSHNCKYSFMATNWSQEQKDCKNLSRRGLWLKTYYRHESAQSITKHHDVVKVTRADYANLGSVQLMFN